VDATEFAILILVRIQALPPELIAVINERFEALDTERRGAITYTQLKRQGDRKSATRAAHHIAEASALHASRKDAGGLYRRLGFG
jgi:hypothetical protein